jgi:hypothetical protein
MLTITEIEPKIHTFTAQHCINDYVLSQVPLEYIFVHTFYTIKALVDLVTKECNIQWSELKKEEFAIRKLSNFFGMIVATAANHGGNYLLVHDYSIIQQAGWDIYSLCLDEFLSHYTINS